MRYHFNSDDTPGRYIYLRDDENGDYWSASWQPVGKDLNEYKSEVHHGTAYTKIFAEYAGIKFAHTAGQKAAKAQEHNFF